MLDLEAKRKTAARRRFKNCEKIRLASLNLALTAETGAFRGRKTITESEFSTSSV